MRQGHAHLVVELPGLHWRESRPGRVNHANCPEGGPSAAAQLPAAKTFVACGKERPSERASEESYMGATPSEWPGSFLAFVSLLLHVYLRCYIDCCKGTNLRAIEECGHIISKHKKFLCSLRIRHTRRYLAKDALIHLPNFNHNSLRSRWPAASENLNCLVPVAADRRPLLYWVSQLCRVMKLKDTIA